MIQQTIEIFFFYAHQDEALQDKLAKHLKLLERQGIIKAWHDRNITAGEEWKTAMRVKATSKLSTDEIMQLTRDRS
jgi:hypothetical protein